MPTSTISTMGVSTTSTAISSAFRFSCLPAFRMITDIMIMAMAVDAAGLIAMPVRRAAHIGGTATTLA